MNHTDIPASAAPTVFDANAPINNTAYEPRTPIRKMLLLELQIPSNNLMEVSLQHQLLIVLHQRNAVRNNIANNTQCI